MSLTAANAQYNAREKEATSQENLLEAQIAVEPFLRL
jgi:hypothetical protein